MVSFTVFTLLFSTVLCTVSANPFVQRNQVSDICGCINGDINIRGTKCGTAATCLCYNDVASYVTRSFDKYSSWHQEINALVKSMISRSSTSTTCTYPSLASAACSQKDVCGFTCANNYAVSSDRKSCVCNSPNTVCNGVCGSFKACSTQGLSRRDATGGQSKRNTVNTWMDRDIHCDVGMSACGVYGGSSSAYECIDSMNDLESCGGCTVPLLSDSIALGKDCTAIKGVSDVSCTRGTCKVHRCMPGYAVSSDGTQCEVRESIRSGHKHKATFNRLSGSHGLKVAHNN